jgi:hypothetical protein
MGGNSIDYILLNISGHLLKMYEGSRSLDITKESKFSIDKGIKKLYDNLHEDVTATVKNFLDSVWCLIDRNDSFHDIEVDYITFRLKLFEDTKFDYDSLYLKKDVTNPYFHSLYLEDERKESEEHRKKYDIAEKYNTLLSHGYDSVNPNTRHVIKVYSNAKQIFYYINNIKQHELYRDTEELRFYLSRVIYDCLHIMHKVDVYVKYYLLISIINELRQDSIVTYLYEDDITNDPLNSTSNATPHSIEEYDFYLEEIDFIDSLPHILSDASIEELQRDLADSVKFSKYEDYRYLKPIQMMWNCSDDYFKNKLKSNLQDILKKYDITWNEEYEKFCFETKNPRDIQWIDKEGVDEEEETQAEKYDRWIKELRIKNLISRYHEYLLR